MISLLKRPNGHLFTCPCLDCEVIDAHMTAQARERRARQQAALAMVDPPRPGREPYGSAPGVFRARAGVGS